jgi:hypothetical protein
MSFSKNALGVIKQLAPTIATALGGPFAGLALNVLAEKIGLDPDKVEAAVLGGDPDLLMKVKESEHDFKLKMKELGLREEELHQKDRADARALAIAKGMVPQVTLSVVFVVGYFLILAQLITGNWMPPEGAGELLAGLVGVLTAGVIKVMDFWFGSSAGSKAKTEAMAAGMM